MWCGDCQVLQNHFAPSGGCYLPRLDDADPFVAVFHSLKNLLLHGQWLKGDRLFCVFVSHFVQQSKVAHIGQHVIQFTVQHLWHSGRDVDGQKSTS